MPRYRVAQYGRPSPEFVEAAHVSPTDDGAVFFVNDAGTTLAWYGPGQVLSVKLVAENAEVRKCGCCGASYTDPTETCAQAQRDYFTRESLAAFDHPHGDGVVH